MFIQALTNLLANKAAEGSGPIKVVDIGCGNGRATIDALVASGVQDAFLIMQDSCADNLHSVQVYAQQRGVKLCVYQGDAFSDFDYERIASLEPDIVVASNVNYSSVSEEDVAHYTRQLAAIVPCGGEVLLNFTGFGRFKTGVQGVLLKLVNRFPLFGFQARLNSSPLVCGNMSLYVQGRKI